MGLVHTNGWVVIDTETTHKDATIGEIIEISLQTDKGEILTLKIAPERIEDALEEALKINGYTPEGWRGALAPCEAEPQITKLMRDRVIIGHNPDFDMQFLKVFYERIGAAYIWKQFDRRYVNTQVLAYEHLVPFGIKSVSLHNICKFLGISNSGAHGARRDVERTLEVFTTLCRPSRWNRHIGFRMMGARYKFNHHLKKGIFRR